MYNSLEWGLSSPPKPHAFTSLPLQSNSLIMMLSIIKNSRTFSTASPNYSPTQNEVNANNWSKKRAEAQEEAHRISASIQEKRRDKRIENDEHYKIYNDWLTKSEPGSEEAKQEEMQQEFSPEKISDTAQDEATTMRAKCTLEIKDLHDKGLSDDSPEIKQVKKEYRHEMRALNDALKDNGFDVSVDPSLDADPENTNLAILVRGAEVREDVFKELCDSDPEKYKSYVEEYFKEHPESDTKEARDELQEYVDDKKDIIRERDEYLANQLLSEPMDLFDPDA